VSCGVVVQDLGVRFAFDRQRRPVTPALARLRRKCSSAWGLRGVTFSVEPGEGVGLIGPNGAGKTTVLRTIAGVLAPDEGRVEVRGRIGAVLSIDAGLLPRLTGRENSLLLGVLAGMTRTDVRARLPSIQERSGLGEAFDRPVASYSQGLRARLGFAVIDEAEPQVLLLDEVHEAVDHSFRAAAEERAARIRQQGGIVIAAGHDHEALGRLCDRAVAMERSTVRAIGPFDEIVTLSEQG
jgi:lipopolysaccharide transport system ATP-binding protein